MNSKRSTLKRQAALGLALLSLLCLAVGCGPVLPTAPAMDAAANSQLSRTPGSDVQVLEGDDTDGGGTTWEPAPQDPIQMGSGWGQNGNGNALGHKKPKKH